MKSFLLVIVFLLIGNTALTGQTPSVNDYKYVLVPQKYGWAKKADVYQINSLTTFLFKKYGFQAYSLGETLPVDLNEGGCNTLTADVEEESSFLRTKLKVVLKDCKGDVVYISPEGVSRLKEFKPAYHEALREAFYSIRELNYAYNGLSEKATALPKATAPKQVTVKEKKVTATPKVQEPSVVIKPQAAPQPEVPLVKENPAQAPQAQTIVNKNSIDRYISLDGTYHMDVDVGKITFYEGDQVIGVMVTKAAASYDVATNEFSGKGYFSGNQFIVDRKIKGLQAPVKMIFEKQ